jgi:hypothetical protein
MLECVQNRGHEIPLDDHKMKSEYQSHCTSRQKITLFTPIFIYSCEEYQETHCVAHLQLCNWFCKVAGGKPGPLLSYLYIKNGFHLKDNAMNKVTCTDRQIKPH